jgi:hypothetical protein
MPDRLLAFEQPAPFAPASPMRSPEQGRTVLEPADAPRAAPRLPVDALVSVRGIVNRKFLHRFAGRRRRARPGVAGVGMTA